MLSSFTTGKRKWLLVVLAVLVVLSLITILLPGKKGNSNQNNNQTSNSNNPTATTTSSSVSAVPTYQLAQTTVQASPSSSGGGTGTTSYEAEATGNILSGMAQIVSCSECSGGKRVAYIRSGSKLQFNNINVSATGTYILTIYYVDGLSQRDAKMSVNNGPQYLLSNFHSTDDNNWNFVQSTTEVITLNQGNNTITFTNGTYPNCIDIDRITIGTE